MKKRNRISHVVITSLAAAALSSVTPASSVFAESLVWNGATTWSVGGAGWTDQFGASKTFVDGSDAYFGSGKGPQNVSLQSAPFSVGILTVNAGSGDSYDFSGGYIGMPGSGSYLSGTLTIANTANINLSNGARVRFNALASTDATSRINLEGNGTVVFSGSTSGITKGTIYIGEGITLQAGTADGSYYGSGGIGNTNIVNNGRIELWRGAGTSATPGEYTLDGGNITGTGEIHKFLNDTVTITKGIGYNTLHIHAGTVKSNPNASLFNAKDQGATSGNVLIGPSLVMYNGGTFDMNNQAQTIYGLDYNGTTGVARFTNSGAAVKTLMILRSVDGEQTVNLRNIQFDGNQELYLGNRNEEANNAISWQGTIYYEIGAAGVKNAFKSTGDNTGIRIGHFKTAVRIFKGDDITYDIGTNASWMGKDTWNGPLSEVWLRAYNGARLEFGEAGVSLANAAVRLSQYAVLDVNYDNITLRDVFTAGESAAMYIRGNDVTTYNLNLANNRSVGRITGKNFTVANDLSLTGGNLTRLYVNIPDSLPTINFGRYVNLGSGLLQVQSDVTFKAITAGEGKGMITVRHGEHQTIIDGGRTMTLAAGTSFFGWYGDDYFQKYGAGTLLIEGTIGGIGDSRGGTTNKAIDFNVNAGTVKIGANAIMLYAGTDNDIAMSDRINVSAGATFDALDWTRNPSNSAFSFVRTAKWWLRTVNVQGTFKGDINVDDASASVTSLANMEGNLAITLGTVKSLGTLTGDLTYTGGTLEGNVKSVTGAVTAGAVTLGHIAKIGGDLSLTGTTWNFNRSIGLTLTGSATIDATSKIILAVPGAKNGDVLFTATGGATGVASGITLEGLLARQTGTISVSGNNVILNIVNSDRKDLVWDWTKAAATSPANTWNNTLLSWTAAADTFVDEDYVTFNTAAGSAKTVDVTAVNGVSVSQMNINPSLAADDFTFTGNKITLLGDLRFNGLGKATLGSVAFSANSVLSVIGGGELILNEVSYYSPDAQNPVTALNSVSLDGGSTLSGSASIKANRYDLGTGILNAKLIGEKSVVANVSGNLQVSAVNAFDNLTLDMLSGSTVVANTDNALDGGVYVQMGNNTTLRLNGHANEVQQIWAKNRDSASGVIVENGAATATKFIVWNDKDGGGQVNMSGILFRDGGSGTLALELHTKDGQTTIMMNSANTYTGGTYFMPSVSEVFFDNGQAFGTGPMYLYGNRVRPTKTMTIANDIIVSNEATSGIAGTQSNVEFRPLNGVTLTFTGDLKIAEGSMLLIRPDNENTNDYVTAKFASATPYTNLLGYVGLWKRAYMIIDASGTADGVTKADNVPNLDFNGGDRTIVRIIEDVTLHNRFRISSNDSYLTVDQGATATFKGNFTTPGDRQWFNVDGGGTLVFSGDGAGQNGFQTIINTGFTLHDGVTLILGDNDNFGNINVKGSGDIDVTRINIKKDSTLILNWAGDYEIKFKVNNEYTYGSVRKQAAGTALLARDMGVWNNANDNSGGATVLKMYVDAGGMIFGTSERYGNTFTSANNSRSLSTLEKLQFVQVASGAVVTLDYARAADADNTGEHKFLLPIGGAGDLVVGNTVLGFNAIYNIAPNADTFTGKTTVNTKNTLRVRSGSFVSLDVTVNADGSMEYYTSTDFTDISSLALVSLNRLENRGTFKGNLMMGTGSHVEGIGNITGNVSFDGATVVANSAITLGTVNITGSLGVKDTSLSFRLSGLSTDPYDHLAVTGNVTAANSTINLIGLGGFTVGQKYTLITSDGPAISGFTGASAAGSRATFGIDTATTPGSLIVQVLTGGADLVWKNHQNNGLWNLNTTQNWDNTGTSLADKFYAYDSVSFGTVGAGTVNIVGSLSAGRISVEENGYTFTGGSIAGELSIAAGKSVIFNNAGVSFAKIAFGDNVSVLTLNQSADAELFTELTGAGTLEKLGTNVLRLSVGNTDFSGAVKVSAGTLDLLSDLGTTASIVLDGGTLTSSNNNAVIASAVNLIADSTIDLGGATYGKWLSNITGADTHKLTLKNGTLSTTTGEAIVGKQTPVGGVMIVNELILDSGAVLNRPVAGLADTSKLHVIADASLASYGTLDLSGENGGSKKLTVDIDSGKTLTSTGFIYTTDTTSEFVKSGSGKLVFAPLTTPAVKPPSVDGYQTPDDLPMQYNGKITVEAGTLEFRRSDGADWKPPFMLNDQPTIVVKGGAALFSNGTGALGRATGLTPHIILEENSTLTASGIFFTENLEMTGASLVNATGLTGTLAIDPTNGSHKSENATIKVHAGSTPTTSTSLITVNTFAPEADITFDVDSGATLKMSSSMSGNNQKITIAGLGKVIWTGSTSSHTQGDVTINAGATLQGGDDLVAAEAGGITNAKIINNGTILHYRDGNYNLDATVTGTGNLTKYRTGQMQVNKANTFTGLTTIEEGTVKLGSDTATLRSDILAKTGTTLDFTAYASGYGVGAGSGEGWSRTEQVIELASGSTLTGKALLNNGGKLYSDAATTGSITANTGSIIGGTKFGGAIGDVLELESGSTFALGKMTGPISGTVVIPSIDAVSVTGGLTLKGGSTLKFDVDNTTPASGLADNITYTGTLSIAASATDRILLDIHNLNTGSTTGVDGTYTLLLGANTYTSAQLTAMGSWFKLGRAIVDLTSSTTGSIVLKITGSQSMTLTWAGQSGGVWNNNVEGNAATWFKGHPATTDQTWFINEDTVWFDDSAANTTVTVDAAGVSAKEMTVVGKNYTFNGTGAITTNTTGAGLKIDGVKATFNNAVNAFSKVVLANNGTLVLGDNQATAGYVISGTGNLEKAGTGTLDLSLRIGADANTYTGTTTVSGGTLKVAALDNIGAGTVVLNGGTLETATSFDLSNAGARTLDVGASGGSVNVGNTLTTVAKLGTLSGSLTKLGDGTLQIQDNATLTKSVTITAGTLQAKGSKFASLNGAGTLDMNTSALRVQSGSFSGSFANLDKLVVGNVDSGTSSEKFTYSGGDITASTTIEDGSTLEANVTLGSGKHLVAGNFADVTTAIKGNLTLNTGSELHIAEADTGTISTGTVGTLKVEGNVSLSGANIHASADFGNAVDKIQATGKLTLDAANDTSIDFESDGSWGTNSYTLANFATLDIQGSADVADAFIVKGLTRKELVYNVTGTSISFTVASQAASWTWDNLSGNGRWDMYDVLSDTDATDNWNDNGSFYTPDSFAAGDNAKFTDNASGAINVWGLVTGSGNGAVNVNNVVFENTSGHDYSFSGGNLVANKITTSSTGNVTFNNAVTANQILVNGTGNLTLNGVGSKITEQMYVTNGTVTLGASGVLVDTKVMMDGANGKLVNASGMTNTLSRLMGTTGTVDLTGSTLKVESGSYSGKVVGNSSSILEKSGNSGLALSGLNTTDYQGALNVTGGTLTLNGANEVLSFNTSTGTSVVLGGNLTVGSGSSDGNISGSGNLTTKGNFGLGGSNSFSGSLIVESGTTTLNSATALSSSSGINVKNLATLDLNGNSISAAALSAESGATIKLNNANLTSNSNTDSQFAGNLIDNGMLIKDGSGKLTLSGTNTFSGGLDINKGSVEVSSAGSLGTGALNVKDSASLIFNGSVASTNAVNVSGKGTLNTVSGSSTVDTVTLANSSSSFVKSGDGELTLNNGITLNGGKLFVNGGKLTSSNDLIINSGELLGGGGTVNSNVVVKSGGKVSPGNSIGQLTISGDATFEASSLLDIEVSSLADASLSGISQSDRLTVDGLLTIDALTVNVLKSGSADSFTADFYKFLILEAGSTALNIASLTVDSSDILFTEDYKTTFVQEGNNIYMLMNINRPEYYQYVDGENQGNVAAYLDGGWDNANTFWKKTVPSAVRANPGQASEFLDQLSGYSLAHATQSRELAGEHFRQLWSQRLMTGIAAQPSLDKSTVNINPTEAMSMAKFKDAESEMKESYWAQPFTYDTSMKSENHVKGYDYRSNGVTAGFDTRFDTGMVIGSAFFYEDGNIETKRSSDKTNINDARFAVYGGWDEEDVSLIASASYGIQQYESKRYVNIGDLGGRNKADYDGNTYGVSIDGAVRITKQMRVFAGFDWLNVSRDSFHEKGSDFAMDVSKETHDMLASRLGVRYDRYFGNFGVYGLVAWRHRFDDTASDLKGSYDGTPGSFKSNGLSNDPDSALLGLGGEYNVTPNYSIFADVNADLNTDHTELGLSAGLRYTW